MKFQNRWPHALAVLAFGAFAAVQHGGCQAVAAPMALSSQTSRPPAFDPRTTGLGAGDQLMISVADLDEVSKYSARIAPDGTLDLPLIGTVEAGGTTLASLRSLLVAKYAKYVTNPQISMQLVSSQNRLVSILGEVNTPSVQELSGPLTLLAAISKAGGTKADAGPQVIVTREATAGPLPLPGAVRSGPGGTSRAAVSLDDLLAERSPESNILLQPGDVVSVPKGSIVYVIGDVHKAGGFALRSTGTVSVIEALSLAEGLGPNAKGGSAKILRPSGQKDGKRQEIPVNVGQVLAGKQDDPKLFADDILFIPSSAAKTGFRRAAEAALQVSTGVLIYR